MRTTKVRVIRAIESCGLIALSLAIIGSSDASAQVPPVHPNLSCSATGSVPVYFNPANLTAAGYDVALVREAMLNAMAIVNEESQSRVDLYYAGDTNLETITPGIVINFNTTWWCPPAPETPDNPLAKAFGCGGNGVIRFFMNDCDGTARTWMTNHSTPNANLMWDAVAVHELLHISHGFPDRYVSPTEQDSVMFSYAGPHNNMRHLYPIDVDSAMAQAGQTTRRPRYATASNATATTFGGVVHVDSSTSSNYGASVDWRYVNGGTADLLFGFPQSNPREARLRQGNGVDVARPGGMSGTSFIGMDMAVDPANGTILVAWLGRCVRNTHCPVNWAFSNTNGSAWLTGTLPGIGGEGSIARPVVAFDRSRFRFVIFYLTGDDGFLASASTSAYWPSFTEVLANGYSRLRYLGGATFRESDGAGRVFAALDSTGTSLQHRIAGMVLIYSGGAYTAGSPVNVHVSNPDAFRTRRSFGAFYSDYQNRTVLAWRDGGAPRPLATSYATGMPTSGFALPAFPISNVRHSVDVTYNQTSNRWVVGVNQ